MAVPLCEDTRQRELELIASQTTSNSSSVMNIELLTAINLSLDEGNWLLRAMAM